MTNTQTNRKFGFVLVAASVVALVACGGGGGGNNGFYGGLPGAGPGPGPGTDTGTGTGNGSGSGIPSSALVSVDAFVAYLKELIASSSDTSDPVNLGDAVLPTDDTREPIGL